jgi:hypothetical protein
MTIKDVRHECALCEAAYRHHSSGHAKVGTCICENELGKFITYHNGTEVHNGFIGISCRAYVVEVSIAGL